MREERVYNASAKKIIKLGADSEIALQAVFAGHQKWCVGQSRTLQRRENVSRGDNALPGAMIAPWGLVNQVVGRARGRDGSALRCCFDQSCV
ncbi:hypothetical protein BaRGS_00008406 [Batillaria attramentaria]|uniref:Uncharacterized protein n=1 Tax=Batillaria attramentaria TaxID=370345 RepID=A0ABD0LNA6_9CAEN